jgi:hypothetical protein
MKWSQRFDNEDEVPEELRGKSPKEVADALKRTQELEKQAADSKRAADDATAARVAQQNDFDTMKARVAELEAGSHQKTAEELEAERLAAEPASPWIDPQKFVQDQTKGIAAVALQSGMMTAKMYCLQNITPRDQKIFKKYEGEIDKMVGTFAPETRVMPQSWFNALVFIKGAHDVDIHKAENDKSDFFSEPASRGHQEEEAPQDKLTDEESAMCDAMHWDKEGYLKQKKQQSIHQSSKGSYARFPVPVKANS